MRACEVSDIVQGYSTCTAPGKSQEHMDEDHSEMS